MSVVVEDMTCKELVELVTDYFEDALPAEDRDRFEAHIGACGPCTRYLEQMRQTIAAAGRLSEGSVDPAARDAMLAAFRNWNRDGR